MGFELAFSGRTSVFGKAFRWMGKIYEQLCCIEYGKTQGRQKYIGGALRYHWISRKEGDCIYEVEQ